MSERIKEELDELFPRPTPLTPEFLPPYSKINELHKRLEDTNQWRKFNHRSNETRRIKLTLSDLERAIPFIHHILDDPETCDMNDYHGSKNKNHNSAVLGIALHEASSLFELLSLELENPEEVALCFPTYKDALIDPYIDALKRRQSGLSDVWHEFQGDYRLVDRQRDLLPPEFRELPLSVSLQEEARIRTSSDVFCSGVKLSEERARLQVGYGRKQRYCEVLSIFNFKELSPEGHSRIQIPVQFDSIAIDQKHESFRFVDLKTGRQGMDYTHKVQAYIMKFLVHHLIQEFYRKDRLKRTGKPFVTRPIKHLLPRPNLNCDLSYNYFNPQSGKISELPIGIDFSKQGAVEVNLFMELLAFYSDAFVVFKNEIKSYLENGCMPDLGAMHAIQHEMPLGLDTSRFIFDLSNLSPARPKSENKYEGPFYYSGENVPSDERCHICGSYQTTQQCFVHPNRLGGPKTLIETRLDCHNPRCMHSELNKIVVPNEAIIYQQEAAK